MDYDSCPHALRSLPDSYVVHSAKIPLDLRDIRRAGPHDDPVNQRPLREALRISRTINNGGIGFSITDNYCVIDFDDAVDKATTMPLKWAATVLAALPPTYIEFSPSGGGLHAIIKVADNARKMLMEAVKTISIAKGKIELLRKGFYATVTGRLLAGCPDTIAELDERSLRHLFIRMRMVQKADPPSVDTHDYPDNIKDAKDEDIIGWKNEIRHNSEETQLNPPTFSLIWWGIYHRRDPDVVEREMLALYEESLLKNHSWIKHRREIKNIVARCVRKSVDVHKKVAKWRDDAYELTDSGAAQFLFENDCGILYTDEAGWLKFNGRVWMTISNPSIIRMDMHRILVGYYKELMSKINDIKKEEALFKWIKLLHSNKILTNCEALARGTLADHYTDFDQDRSLLNCLNGTIDLKTGFLMPHDADSKLISIANLPYFPEIADNSPMFDKFISEMICGDQELAQYLLYSLGYSITGETREQVFFVLYGAGANGKSTLLNVMSSIFGRDEDGDRSVINAKKYYGSMRPEALVNSERGNDGVGNDLAALAKTRLVVASEIGDRRVRDERLKSVVGEDKIQARFLFHEFFEIQPRMKLWIQTNHKPKVRGDDNAIWRRARMIPCLADFRENPDKHMYEKLYEERERIFAKIVAYAGLWYQNGLPPLPESVRAETELWRNEVDAIARFMEECVAKVPGKFTINRDLWGSWTDWCDDNKERPGTSAAFYKRINELYEGDRRKLYGETVRGYIDMQLLTKNNGVDI